MENLNILLFALPMLAISFILLDPSKFGVQAGSINREGRSLFIITFTTLLVFLMGGILVMKFVIHHNPYSRAGYEVVILSPVIEELFFRGILFHLLSIWVKKFSNNKYNLPITIAINSLLFGAIHFLNLLNPQFTSLFVAIQVLQAFLMGIIFCYLRYKSDSVYPPIFLHIMWNFIAVQL